MVENVMMKVAEGVQRLSPHRSCPMTFYNWKRKIWALQEQMQEEQSLSFESMIWEGRDDYLLGLAFAW